MNANGKYDFIDREMKRRDAECQRRRLRSVSPISEVEIKVDGQTKLNFCSNDYLGLSKHPLLKERALEFMERHGSGATASRLVCGDYECFKQTENKLTELKKTESALILNSGFQANLSVLSAITDKNSLILSDRSNHSSIIQGTLLSRCSKALFDHNDMEHLRSLLEERHNHGYSRVIIISESVFSMDGDRCDIDRLVELADEFQAILIIDEAHATGVLGERGMGLTRGKKVDLTIGTFGKACGSFGSYVACSRKIRDYLINCCAGFIYSTALPPSVIGCVDAALDLIPKMDEERRGLHSKADFLRSSFEELGWSAGNSTTQIVPLVVGDESEALALSAFLEKEGIFASAIRPPTVEPGRARVRFTVSAAHTWEHTRRLINILRKWTNNG